MHESSISYHITRPYPFRWVTPLIAVGAIIALVLFSVLNFASSGYTLVSEYSTNPNTTTQHWFEKWPASLRSKIHPICPPTAVPINSLLYTNNTAFQYNLNSVRPLESGIVSLPSLVYINNPLVRCGVQSIQMIFDMNGRTANQMAISQWGVELQGIVTCIVHGPAGSVNITLNTNYNFFPSTMSTYAGQYEFPGRNATHSASLWWAESLLSYYYLHLLSVFDDAIGDQNKMSLSLQRNPNGTLSLSDQDYFSILERDTTIYTNFETRMNLSAKPHDTHDGITRFSDPVISGLNSLAFRTGWIREENSTFSKLIAHTPGPNIWPIVDRLAKAFESTILTDLGQVDAGPNVLVDAKLLQKYTTDFPAWYNASNPMWVGIPATADYEALKKTTGPLVVNPSTLAITYLCQIPKRKPAGDLITSVLVADLVFLQALWLVFTFVLGYLVQREDAAAGYCVGCATRIGNEEIGGGKVEYKRVSDGESSTIDE